ncbi:MAG: immunity 49 family protein [Betaproteobacteria bacterium]
MTAVPFAPFDIAAADRKTRDAREFVDELTPELGSQSHALSMFIGQCTVAAAGLALDNEPAAPRYLSRGARAAALLCVGATHPGEAPAIALDDEHVALLDGTIDPSLANAREWLDAMWPALAVGDLVAQRWLAAVDADRLEPAGVALPPQARPMVDLLRALALRDGSHGSALIAALEALVVETPAAAALRDYTEAIDEPALRACAALLGDAPERFAQALEELLRKHAARHAGGGFGSSNRALLSLPACALRRLAEAKGWAPAVTSGYMPEVIWRAAATAEVQTCPYCVYPLPPAAARCGLCGERSGRDAPLDFTGAAYVREPLAACGHCGYPMLKLAVRCPRCRTRRPHA